MPSKRRDVDYAPDIWLASSPKFSGGVVTATDPRDIEKEECTLTQNAYVSRSGRVVKREGYSNVLAAALPYGPVRAARRFKSEDGTIDCHIIFDQHSVIELQDDGTWRYLAFALLDGDAESSPGVAHCEYGGAVYFSDGKTGLFSVEQASAAAKAKIWASDTTDPYNSNWFVSGSITAAGSAGNAYTLEFVDPGTPSASLSVSLVGTAITVNLATDANGGITSTCNDIVTALNGDAGIAAVTDTWTTGSGTEVVDAMAATSFYGGADIGDLIVTGDAAADPLYSVPYSFTYLAARKSSERIFGIDAADTTNVRYCDALTPETWNSASLISPGGVFTGLLEIGSVMLLYQDDDIFRIDGTDPTTWEVTKATAKGLGLPAAASGTLIAVEDVATYLSPRGLTVYDGTRPRPLSDPIKHEEDSTKNLIPTDADLYDESFLMVVGDEIRVFYKSASSVDGNDRAVVYDYRRGIWSGPWTFAEPVVAGTYDPSNTGNAALPYLVSYAGQVLRQNTAYDDNGTDFLTKLRTRTFDCGREAIDKVVITMRVAYKTAGATSLTVSLYREDDASPACTVTHTVTGAEEDVITKRVPHVRGRDFYIEVSATDDVYFEIGGAEFDYFFVELR